MQAARVCDSRGRVTKPGSQGYGFFWIRDVRKKGNPGDHGPSFLPVAPLELLHLASRIHQLLLAREERMAVGADINIPAVDGGFRLIDGTTSTGKGCLFVIRMYIFFHLATPPINAFSQAETKGCL